MGLTSEIIIDSNMTLEEALRNTNAPDEIVRQQTLLDVEYYSTDNRLHQGQVVINKLIAQDIQEIFRLIKDIRFPIHQAIPIATYEWNDNRSMSANNTSGFCYRKIAGTDMMSYHATGCAIDINPAFNPLIWNPPFDSKPHQPQGAVYDIKRPGTFHLEHPVVQEFINRGFIWGRFLDKYDDNHHFHKIIPSV